MLAQPAVANVFFILVLFFIVFKAWRIKTRGGVSGVRTLESARRPLEEQTIIFEAILKIKQSSRCV